MDRVYIHEIQPVQNTHARHPVSKSHYCPYICYFNTYIDAAIDAYKHQLIRISGTPPPPAVVLD
jgi:hypothetical protein